MDQQDEALKIVCRVCNAKFDVTEFEPFSTFTCPGCGSKLRVPKKFGPYLLERISGLGGMSSVYRAIDPAMSRRVAIKIMSPEAAAEEVLREHFLMQAQLIAKIDHPGIIPIYNSGVEQDQPYLVMKYMDSGSFEHLLHDGKLPEMPQLINLLSIVAGGLQAMLRTGIIHHDLKPGNIMYDSDGSVGLCDFDLAESPLLNGAMCGSGEWASPAYVSPEWLENGGDDFRGDIFGFGVTTYELLTGQIPYQTDGDASVLLERRRHPIHLSVHELQPAISRHFSDFLNSMMAFRAADRPEYPEIIREFQEESKRLAAKPGKIQRILGFIRGK